MNRIENDVDALNNTFLRNINMNHFLKESKERFPNDEILYEVPYKPFSILIVTNHRIVGKGLAKVWTKQFHGELLLSNIISIKRKPDNPTRPVSKIVLEYKANDGIVKKANIVFYISYTTYSGFDFEKIYQYIADKIA